VGASKSPELCPGGPVSAPRRRLDASPRVSAPPCSPGLRESSLAYATQEFRRRRVVRLLQFGVRGGVDAAVRRNFRRCVRVALSPVVAEFARSPRPRSQASNAWLSAESVRQADGRKRDSLGTVRIFRSVLLELNPVVLVAEQAANTSDPWSDVLPSVVTSFLTTLITLGLTGLVAWLSRKKTKQSAPIRVKRGSGDSHYVVNETRRPFTSISANVNSRTGSYRSATGWPGPSLLPGESIALGNLVDGETLLLQWVEFRRGKKVNKYVEVVRIRADEEEYSPKLRKEPDVMHGG